MSRLYHGIWRKARQVMKEATRSQNEPEVLKLTKEDRERNKDMKEAHEHLLDVLGKNKT